MGKTCDIAIVGAGPYGLSLAAHLGAAGADFRIFGKPLSTWRLHMPRGMLLKSDGFASSLSSPDANSTLRSWCAARGIAYDDRHRPVPLATFCDYAGWFQKTHVPRLDVRPVTSLTARDSGYTLLLDNGDTVAAARVVLAVGITHFNCPASWTARRRSLSPTATTIATQRLLAGRHLLVLGAGASAIDTAVLACDAGAQVSLLARAPMGSNTHAMPDP